MRWLAILVVNWNAFKGPLTSFELLLYKIMRIKKLIKAYFVIIRS